MKTLLLQVVKKVETHCLLTVSRLVTDECKRLITYPDTREYIGAEVTTYGKRGIGKESWVVCRQ